MKLNYHHLHYFWRVAKADTLTQAAQELHVSQSALSMQIKQLEDALGHALFHREGRQLRLTESGQMALSYANEIFAKGEELSNLMRSKQRHMTQVLRIGLAATLSRNFVDALIKPLLNRDQLKLSLRSRGLDGLLNELSKHHLDIVLSNAPVRGNQEFPWRCQRIAQQTISIVGHQPMHSLYKNFSSLETLPVIVPGPFSEVRTGFDLLCEKWDIKPNIIAEVDDMAMMRLVARDSDALSVLPPVIVKDEIADNNLFVLDNLPDVVENFYAITIRRQFDHPIITELMTRKASDIFSPNE